MVFETLCLSDINSAAVSSCQHTVRVNKLSDRVSVYQSDNLKSIPRSEMWNLIMSNPPHFVGQYEGDIRAHDPDWRIHRNFFETVSDHLAEDGVIVLQENNRGSILETSRPMISGFEMFFTHGDYSTLTKESSFYFIGIAQSRLCLRGRRVSMPTDRHNRSNWTQQCHARWRKLQHHRRSADRRPT
jgi:16S rRNA G1207 methylase RsmC